jgi:hypothetical protein
MAGASLAVWMVVSALVDRATSVDVLFGMVGPLLVASGSWFLYERTYRRTPERLTSLMVAAFGGKIVFFGLYVAAGLQVLSLRPVPFIVSFAGYFIGLHVTEALCLRRLFFGARKVH